MDKVAKILGIVDKDIATIVRNVFLLAATIASLSFAAGGFLMKAKAFPSEINEIRYSAISIEKRQIALENRQNVLEETIKSSLKNINDKLDSQGADLREQKTDTRELRSYIMGRSSSR